MPIKDNCVVSWWETHYLGIQQNLENLTILKNLSKSEINHQNVTCPVHNKYDTISNYVKYSFYTTHYNLSCLRSQM